MRLLVRALWQQDCLQIPCTKIAGFWDGIPKNFTGTGTVGDLVYDPNAAINRTSGLCGGLSNPSNANIQIAVINSAAGIMTPTWICP